MSHFLVFEGKEMSEAKHTDLTKRIIGAFYAVYNCLGYGFLEKVYENALALELIEKIEQRRTIDVCQEND
jgi:GxxExxY protein